MTNTISAATALELAYAHQEIERGREMLVKLDEYDRKEKEDRKTSFMHVEGITDALRKRRSGYQLSVPARWGTTEGHHIISGVSPEITRHVILAHIEKQKAWLAELCIKARMELDGLVPDDKSEAGGQNTSLAEQET